MPFENPILAGEELIRSAIRSENYSEGSLGWRIGRDGTAEFANMVSRGSTVGENANFDTIVLAGEDLLATLDAMGGTMVAHIDWGVTGETWVGAGPHLIAITTATLKPNHDYMVCLTGFGAAPITSGERVTQNLLYAWDGALPTGASTPLRGPYSNINNGYSLASQYEFNPLIGWISNSGVTERDVTVGLFVTRTTGAGNVTTWAGVGGARMAVIDMGLILPSQGTRYAPGSSSTELTRHTSQWEATDVESYQQDHTISTASNHSVWGYQGDGDPVGNPGGNHASIWIFPYAAMQAALAGSTIITSRVYLDNVHCYNNAGVTARIGSHTSTGIPSIFNGNGGVTENRWQVGCAKGGAVWSTNLGTAMGNDFKNNTIKGLVIGYGFDINSYSYWNRLIVKIVYDN